MRAAGRTLRFECALGHGPFLANRWGKTKGSSPKRKNAIPSFIARGVARHFQALRSFPCVWTPGHACLCGIRGPEPCAHLEMHWGQGRESGLRFTCGTNRRLFEQWVLKHVLSRLNRTLIGTPTNQVLRTFRSKAGKNSL